MMRTRHLINPSKPDEDATPVNTAQGTLPKIRGSTHPVARVVKFLARDGFTKKCLPPSSWRKEHDKPFLLAGRYDVRAGTLIGTTLCFLLLNLDPFTLLTPVHDSRWVVHRCAREDQEPRSRCHTQGVTVTVASIEGWIVQVIWNVPAFAKTIVFMSPPWKVTPPALLRSLGAPLAATNWPPVPITRSCGPPAESSKVTASPALMVILVFPEKTPDPIVIVELLELPLDELPLEQAAKTSARSRMQARTASGARSVICPREDVRASGVQ
jgi:hypothetical protein